METRQRQVQSDEDMAATGGGDTAFTDTVQWRHGSDRYNLVETRHVTDKVQWRQDSDRYSPLETRQRRVQCGGDTAMTGTVWWRHGSECYSFVETRQRQIQFGGDTADRYCLVETR